MLPDTPLPLQSRNEPRDFNLNSAINCDTAAGLTGFILLGLKKCENFASWFLRVAICSALIFLCPNRLLGFKW